MRRQSIRLAAVGDISFMGRKADNPSLFTFLDVLPLFAKSDLVIANLESPLLFTGDQVRGKCVLRASPKWAEVMKNAGIKVLSLANNHIMDFGQTGLLSTIQSLDLAGILHVGAGRNRKEACKPKYINIGEKRLAFLARTFVFVSSPSHAKEAQPGVAFLDIAETKQNIRSCKQCSDIVVLLVHWGIEEYNYPSPYHCLLAKEFIDAGADIIIGHHPHVLQGIETIENKLIAYSLGNFVFDEFHWSFVDSTGKKISQFQKLLTENKKAGILRLNFSGKSLVSYTFLPTFIQPNGTIKIDDTIERKNQFKNLCYKLQFPAYNIFWRLYSSRQEWRLRIKQQFFSKLTWNNISKLRFKHFKQLLDTLWRSARITSEKSTNPYE